MKPRMTRPLIRWALERHFLASVRHVDVRLPEADDHERWAIVASLREAFGAAVAPVMMMSPSRPLFGSMWALLRATLFGTHAARPELEFVAAAVSRWNSCPYCVDAHEARLSGRQTPKNLSSALTPTTGLCLEAPPASGAELLGTAFAFHIVNRMVSVLLPLTPFVGPAPFRDWASRHLDALLPESTVSSPRLHSDGVAPFEWARANRAVADAIAQLDQVMREVCADFVPAEVRAEVTAAAAEWNGQPRSFVSRRLDAQQPLPPMLRSSARLLLNIAISPTVVDEHMVHAARATFQTDEALVSGLAWAAWVAATRLATTWQVSAGLGPR